MTKLRRLWADWREPASTSVLDQAAFSGTHFALNLVLARWSTAEEYGLFAVGFSVLLVVSGLHGAVFVDPIPVVASQRLLRVGGYAQVLLKGQAALTLPLSALSAVALLLLLGPEVPGPVLGTLAAAVSLLCTFWLVRSLSYFEREPLAALRASLVYGVSALTLIAVSGLFWTPTAATGLMAIGVASLVASSSMMSAFFRRNAPAPETSLRTILREHWIYGRWILLAAVAHVFAFGLYVPLAGRILGLADAGTLRAGQNLILPLQQVMTGLSMVVFPALSRGVASSGIVYLAPRGTALAAAGGLVAVAYGSIILTSGSNISTALYGEQQYEGLEVLFLPLTAGAVGLVVSQVLGVVMRAANRPQAILVSKCAAAAALPFGVWLAHLHGAMGIAWGLALASGVECIALGFAYTRLLRTRAAA